MSYFSRLTDIVSCNLSRLLAEADDPQAAIAEIVQEMQEGLAGARRSVATASAAEQRLQREIDEHAAQVAAWADKARERLRGGSEDGGASACCGNGKWKTCWPAWNSSTRRRLQPASIWPRFSGRWMPGWRRPCAGSRKWAFHHRPPPPTHT